MRLWQRSRTISRTRQHIRKTSHISCHSLQLGSTCGPRHLASKPPREEKHLNYWQFFPMQFPQIVAFCFMGFAVYVVIWHT